MKESNKIKKRGQASLEYTVLVVFVTFVVIGVLALAYVYSGGIKDRIKMNQIESFGKKIIATSESIFYSGNPSKATISVYLPREVTEIQITENSIIISVNTNTGITKIAYPSNVPITGTLSPNPGINKIQVIAEEDTVRISQV